MFAMSTEFAGVIGETIFVFERDFASISRPPVQLSP